MKKNQYHPDEFDSFDITSICTDKVLFQISKQRIEKTGKDAFFGQYITDSYFYQLSKASTSQTYKLDSAKSEKEAAAEYTGRFGIISPNYQFYIFSPQEQIEATSQEAYKDRKVLKILTVDHAREQKVRRTILIDQETYQLLKWESDHTVDIGMRGMSSDHTIAEVIYQKSGNAMFPEKYSVHRLLQNGTKQNMLEIEFIDYSRYRPDPKEIDLETQFGIKPIHGTVSSKYFGLNLYVWLIILCVLLFAVGMVLILRYRRSESAGSLLKNAEY